MKVSSAKTKDLEANKKPEAKQHKQDDDEDDASFKDEPSILMPFKELSESRIVKVMRQTYGRQVLPLPVVGHLMNYVGNALLMYIFQLFSTNEKQHRIFYPMHKVEHI